MVGPRKVNGVITVFCSPEDFAKFQEAEEHTLPVSFSRTATNPLEVSLDMTKYIFLQVKQHPLTNNVGLIGLIGGD